MVLFLDFCWPSTQPVVKRVKKGKCLAKVDHNKEGNALARWNFEGKYFYCLSNTFNIFNFCSSSCLHLAAGMKACLKLVQGLLNGLHERIHNAAMPPMPLQPFPPPKGNGTRREPTKERHSVGNRWCMSFWLLNSVFVGRRCEAMGLQDLSRLFILKFPFFIFSWRISCQQFAFTMASFQGARALFRPKSLICDSAKFLRRLSRSLIKASNFGTFFIVELFHQVSFAQNSLL